MTLSIESSFSSRVRLLSTRFRYADTRLFVGWAHLYSDRIELQGFGPRRSGRRRIRLDAVDHVDFGDENENSGPTAFQLTTGERIELFFRKRSLWKRSVLSRLEWNERVVAPQRPLKDPGDCLLSVGV